jgi:hypothetical protein
MYGTAEQKWVKKTINCIQLLKTYLVSDPIKIPDEDPSRAKYGYVSTSSANIKLLHSFPFFFTMPVGAEHSRFSRNARKFQNS